MGLLDQPMTRGTRKCTEESGHKVYVGIGCEPHDWNDGEDGMPYGAGLEETGLGSLSVFQYPVGVQLLCIRHRGENRGGGILLGNLPSHRKPRVHVTSFLKC